LVLRLVTNTGFPAPGFAFGLIASAHKASVTPRIGLLVRAVLTFPVKYKAYAIYKSYCGMLAHPVVTQYTLLAHPVMTQYTLLAHPVMTHYTLLAHPVITQYTLLAHPVMTQYTLLAHPVMTQYRLLAHPVMTVHTAGTPNDVSTHY
jgi:hypothetical protein